MYLILLLLLSLALGYLGLPLPPPELGDLPAKLLPWDWVILSDKCRIYLVTSCSEARVTFNLACMIDPYDLNLVSVLSFRHARRLLLESCSETRVTFNLSHQLDLYLQELLLVCSVFEVLILRSPFCSMRECSPTAVYFFTHVC